MADGFVEQGRGGGGDVQGLDPAEHRDADQAVAERAGTLPEALLLAAQAEHDFARELDLPRRLSRGVRPIDPEAIPLERLQGVGGVGDALDLQPLDRPGRKPTLHGYLMSATDQRSHSRSKGSPPIGDESSPSSNVFSPLSPRLKSNCSFKMNLSQAWIKNKQP